MSIFSNDSFSLKQLFCYKIGEYFEPLSLFLKFTHFAIALNHNWQSFQITVLHDIFSNFACLSVSHISEFHS